MPPPQPPHLPHATSTTPPRAVISRLEINSFCCGHNACGVHPTPPKLCNGRRDFQPRDIAPAPAQTSATDQHTQPPTQPTCQPIPPTPAHGHTHRLPHTSPPTQVFCSRLAASTTGAPVRPKVLVAGWNAGVSTAPFVKREFVFHDAPDQSLGYKLLPRPDAKAGAKEAAATPSSAKPSAPKRSRSDGADNAGSSPHTDPAAAKGKRQVPRSGLAGKVGGPYGAEDAMAEGELRGEGAVTGGETDAEGSSSAQSSSTTFQTFAWGSRRSEEEGGQEEVIELGEVSQMGRFADAPSPRPTKPRDDEGALPPHAADGEATSKVRGETSQDPAEMDEVDAVLADLMQ